VVSVRFPAKRGNASEHLFDALLIGEPNISQRDITGRLSADSFCASNKGRSSSCWEARDDSRGWDEGLFVVDRHEERKYQRKGWWFPQQMTGQWYREDVANVWVKFFSYGGGDSDKLMGVEAVVLAKVLPRLWRNWGDRREPKLWRGGAGGWCNELNVS